MFIFKKLEFQLYLLQLENYHIQRFFKVSLNNFLNRGTQRRQTLIYTAKVKVIFYLSLFFYIVNILVSSLIIFFIFKSLIVGLISFIIASLVFAYLFFIYLIISTLIISPFDKFIKQAIINQAKQKLDSIPHLKIIGLTGSYGKTTTKEMLYDVLSQKYKTVKTEGNLNTPLGIAKTIKEKIAKDTEIFIVEMGAFNQGDIKELCNLTQPDISILTGINESHLERFQTIQNTIATKFEIVKYAKENAIVVLNTLDENIKSNFEKYIDHKKVKTTDNLKVEIKEFFEDGSGQIIQINNLEIKTKFIASYIKNTISLVYLTAQELELTNEEIKTGIEKAEPPKHRMNGTLHPNDVLVIDDSYNGNPAGVKEAISTLSHFKSRRKIYITPGLVEMGDRAESIHKIIGYNLSRVADLVILIDNSSSKIIKQSLLQNNFSEEKIKVYGSMLNLEEDLISILRPNDVVIFQNDWPDNYS